MANVHLRRGHVDPELHAERPSERELPLELALREDVHGVPRELGHIHASECRAGRAGAAARIGSTILPFVLFRRRDKQPRRRRIRWLRLITLVTVLGLVSTVSFLFGLVSAIASELPELEPRNRAKLQEYGYIYASDDKTL